MKFRVRRADSPQIEIAPLIDIVFILLIFFVVTSTFIDEAALELELPSAQSGTVQAPVDSISVVITSLNEIHIGENVVPNPTLAVVKSQLQTLISSSNAQRLVVRADANARHETVVIALDAASLLGVSNVTIVTVKSVE